MDMGFLLFGWRDGGFVGIRNALDEVAQAGGAVKA
jgi:hypothetical protein